MERGSSSKHDLEDNFMLFEDCLFITLVNNSRRNGGGDKIGRNSHLEIYKVARRLLAMI